MAYVQVDIDLDEIDTDDLCNELAIRVRHGKIKKDALKDLKENVQELADELEINLIYEIPNKSLNDKIKLEFLSSIWDKLTPWQLEDKLKSCL